MIYRTPIAVVGMAGLFPGALNLDHFWQNIINKVDTTCEVPKARWLVEPDAIYSPDPEADKVLSKRACLISDFRFDPEGFNFNKNLLKELDPLYHMVLHVGRKAFSSCVTSSLNKSRTGVILAAIVLPTDCGSLITREIIGKSFEQKLFGSAFNPPVEFFTFFRGTFFCERLFMLLLRPVAHVNNEVFSVKNVLSKNLCKKNLLFEAYSPCFD